MADAAATLADIAEDQTEEKGVNALDDIHVEDAKERRLKEVGSPERQRASRLPQGDAAENKLLGNRCKEHRVAEHTDGHGGVHTRALHEIHVLFQPVREDYRDEGDQITGQVLRAGHQKNDAENRHRVEGAAQIGDAAALVAHIIPQTENGGICNRIDDHDTGVKRVADPEIGQICHDLIEICRRSKGIPCALHKGGKPHAEKYDQILDRDGQYQWYKCQKEMSGFSHNLCSPVLS